MTRLSSNPAKFTVLSVTGTVVKGAKVGVSGSRTEARSVYVDGLNVVRLSVPGRAARPVSNERNVGWSLPHFRNTVLRGGYGINYIDHYFSSATTPRAAAGPARNRVPLPRQRYW